MKEKKRRGPVCTLCLQSGVHLDACVNPNNRREDGRCCADGCSAMLLAQECPRRQGGVCRHLVEETAEVVEAGVAGDAMVVESQDVQVGAENSGAGSQPQHAHIDATISKKYRTKHDKRLTEKSLAVVQQRYK